jgi:hypothetical protein
MSEQGAANGLEIENNSPSGVFALTVDLVSVYRHGRA